jgi:hypothetical protein
MESGYNLEKYNKEPDELKDELEEGAGQDIIDELEAESYDLAGIDEKIVNDILKTATTNFDVNPAKWSKLIEEVMELIRDNRKGELEDEETFTGHLQEKLAQAHDLTEN